MEWKRFAISQAKDAMGSYPNEYLQACIAQRECLLFRISGALDQATCSLAEASIPTQPQANLNNKNHAGFGQTIIQRALNHIQVEELALATQVLNMWQPLGEIPSQIEEVVLFRKHLILGKISRFQGNFNVSLGHLQRSKGIADKFTTLSVDEDRSDLVYNLADTLQELGDHVNAEHQLRTEIARSGHDRTSAQRILKLALAESLFSQGRHEQASALCFEIQTCPKTSKIENLRLCIVQAKLCHVHSDWDGALRHWTDAMLAVGRFKMTSGHTTRIILFSICYTLRCQGRHELELKSSDQFAILEKLAGPGGSMHWIAGLRHWLIYMQSTDTS